MDYWRNKMKKNIYLIMTLLFPFFLTSCVDAFHYVGLENGNVEITVKYSIQKMLIEMAASFGEEEVDYSEFTDMGDEMFDELSRIEAQITPIDTELEIGAEISFSGPLKSVIEYIGDDAPYFPMKTGNIYQIRIPCLGSEDDEEDEAAAAFMASAKYKLLIDLSGDLNKTRNIRFSIKDESIEMEEWESFFSVEIFNHIAYIEIPMILLMSSTDDIIVELY